MDCSLRKASRKEQSIAPKNAFFAPIGTETRAEIPDIRVLLFFQKLLDFFRSQFCGLFLGNSLVLLCLLFLKIQNSKFTNLAGSLDGAPIHSINSKTKNLSRDRSILQRFIHTVGIRCFPSIHRLQCNWDCDLRACCAAAVQSHNTACPLRRRRGLILWVGVTSLHPKSRPRKKFFCGPRHVLATEAE